MKIYGGTISPARKRRILIRTAEMLLLLGGFAFFLWVMSACLKAPLTAALHTGALIILMFVKDCVRAAMREERRREKKHEERVW